MIKRLTHFQIRKKWRIKLHAKRCEDNDQSGTRYSRDASVLNRAMDMYKIDGRRAAW
jgi:hypothetical protein